MGFSEVVSNDIVVPVEVWWQIPDGEEYGRQMLDPQRRAVAPVEVMWLVSDVLEFDKQAFDPESRTKRQKKAVEVNPLMREIQITREGKLFKGVCRNMVFIGQRKA
eukprot:gnl/MRDRNA2_/MRDRNA2_16988_c0_seq1.p2 gnl/MRDRNA2_/MRDRNA2_16988_c0~~gnl/MRDRNA2_/MRDRNA2_16988_c0_seq1.p2  ORF type:complete len:106 (+),score=20.09 gnl/MRDRNA2_/MRDRNA2_16988_c0_seq1:123-440(+)